jgi:hypothetical protein
MPLETLQTTVRLRPTRIGFVVDPADGNSVLRFMRYCTGLWGGRFNPIIPSSYRLPRAWRGKRHSRPSSSDLTNRYISFFEPDVFVTATDRPLGTSYKEDKLEFSQPRVRKLEEFVAGDDRRTHDFAFGLNMLDVYRHLYSEEFKFVRKHEAKFVLIDDSEEINPFFVATAGAFPGDKELSYLEKAYGEIFDPEVIKSDCSTMEKLIRREIATPLGLTNYEVDIDTEWQHDHLIFVLNPNVPADLIDYWNLCITCKTCDARERTLVRASFGYDPGDH